MPDSWGQKRIFAQSMTNIFSQYPCLPILFLVAQMDECRLPEWLVAKSTWTNLEGRIRLTMTPGIQKEASKWLWNLLPRSAVRRKMRKHRNRDPRANFRHQDGVEDPIFEDNDQESNLEEITSHLTCHKLIAPNGGGKGVSKSWENKTKVVAYQKVGW